MANDKIKNKLKQRRNMTEKIMKKKKLRRIPLRPAMSVFRLTSYSLSLSVTLRRIRSFPTHTQNQQKHFNMTSLPRSGRGD